jgi:hypothetical protein
MFDDYLSRPRVRKLLNQEEIFVDGILNYSRIVCESEMKVPQHKCIISISKRLSIVSRVHMLMANDDEKVKEDEIAFFTALISYSTFYGVAHYFFCRMTQIS